MARRSVAGWRARWHAWRDRLLGDPRFQRWAADFPLTRPLAQRRARELFDLCAGFVYSQILFACVELDLFSRLRAAPLDAAELAAATDLTPAAAERLLRAAVALRLLERRGDGRFGLGPHGAALLGHPGVAAMVRHHALLYRDLAAPLALLRGTADTELKRFWAYVGTDDPRQNDGQAVGAYSELMTASQTLVADDTLDAYPLARHRCLLDLGGGEGHFVVAAAQRWPSLRALIFDLPAVAARANARLAALGLTERLQAHGGDLFRDPLPPGADLVSLVRVLHDHDDAPALAILRAARAALPTGGTLLISEPMSETPGAEPVGDAYFGFYLLAMGSGRPRPPRELIAMLTAAGFGAARLLPTRRPLLTRVLVAQAT